MEVLVIDAEPASAQLAATMMRSLGHDVVSVEDVASGLRLLGASWGSLVLVDRELPDVCSIDFCRRVRERYDARYVHLVVMCAQRDLAGDVFDFFELTDELFRFYAVDVVGHGASAAMTSHSVRHLMRGNDDGPCRHNLERRAGIDETVSRTMRDPNRSFHVDDDHRWSAMMLGIVEQGSGRVTLCQAGHSPAVHVARATGHAELIGTGGLPVAMFGDADFVPVHCTLAPGDRLAPRSAL